MTKAPAIPLRSNEAAREAVNIARGTTGFTWEQLGVELGIPAGTLWDIAHGKPVPGKWRQRLGLRRVKDLYAMPVAELRWALENREEI